MFIRLSELKKSEGQLKIKINEYNSQVELITKEVNQLRAELQKKTDQLLVIQNQRVIFYFIISKQNKTIIKHLNRFININ